MRAVDQKKQTEPCVSWKLLDQPLFQLHRRPATTVTVLESPLYLQINPQEMPPHRPALFLGFLFHRPPFTAKTGFSPWDGFFPHTHTHTRKKKELELSWMKVSPFICKFSLEAWVLTVFVSVHCVFDLGFGRGNIQFYWSESEICSKYPFYWSASSSFKRRSTGKIKTGQACLLKLIIRGFLSLIFWKGVFCDIHITQGGIPHKLKWMALWLSQNTIATYFSSPKLWTKPLNYKASLHRGRRETIGCRTVFQLILPPT